MLVGAVAPSSRIISNLFRGHAEGKLSVDVDVDPPVDRHSRSLG
jgi:hypothetical protein